MITDWQIQRRDGRILLGIAVDHAVLDVETDAALLKACLTMLRSQHRVVADARMGGFGECEVRLTLRDADTAAIFIDGPAFEVGRYQSAAIWVDRARLCQILEEVVGGG